MNDVKAKREDILHAKMITNFFEIPCYLFQGKNIGSTSKQFKGNLTNFILFCLTISTHLLLFMGIVPFQEPLSLLFPNNLI